VPTSTFAAYNFGQDDQNIAALRNANMDLQLKGKRALVTGSNTGIGKGIATVLAREGATVIIHGRNRERAEATVKELQATGAQVQLVLGDVSSPDGAKAVIDGVNALGGVDILVNNAGGNEIAGGGNPEWFDVPPEHWVVATEQNIVTIVRLVQGLAPGMKERGWGRIINIGSLGGLQPTQQVPNYCAAKAALVNLTLSLSKALARTGVTVNTVSPGLIRTPFLEGWLAGIGQHMGWDGTSFETLEARATSEMFPLSVSKIGTPEDIGNVVAFLASPLNAYITGSNVHIDGGQTSEVG
jgi:NAD(P)-dependent dehydrogenase (short-subunit alcohol dehydrogenase family)